MIIIRATQKIRKKFRARQKIKKKIFLQDKNPPPPLLSACVSSSAQSSLGMSITLQATFLFVYSLIHRRKDSLYSIFNKEQSKIYHCKIDSFSYDRERIGKLILTSKHQIYYFLFVLICYYKLNGLFSFTVM